MMQKTQHRTKIIAHRGDTSRAPENTLESFEAARENGADGIELDVHITRGGILVVHHDYYLGNPDNGRGTIPDLSLGEFSRASIKNTYSLPTLEQVFAKIGNTLHYELELKAFTKDAVQKVVGLIHQFNITTIEITSPHPFVLTKIKQLDPTLTTGYFCMPRPDWMDPGLYRTICIANAKLGDINVVHISSEYVDEPFITTAHSEEIKVHAADCDDTNDLIRVFNLGADQVSTNRLATAIAARKQVSPR